MSADPLRDNLSSPFPLVALLLIAAGLIFPSIPLQSPRPTETERLKPPPAPSVPARLWQDPLAAVELGRRNQEAGKGDQAAVAPVPGLDSVRSELDERHQGSSEVLLLPVMVGGGPFPDDAETRRRIRYAVVNALTQQEFVPEDAEHIRYVQWSPVEPECSSGASSGATAPSKQPALRAVDPCRRPVFVPFEWYRREQRWALVVWLREEDFFQDTIGRYAGLIGELTRMPPTRSSAGRTQAQKAPVRVSIIGPMTSSLYIRILQDFSLKVTGTEATDASRSDARGRADRRVESRPADVLERLRFFSYGATIPEQLAAEEAFGPGGRPQWRTNPVVRVIGGDDALVDALAQELERRGVNRGDPTPDTQPRCLDKIVLLVEADYPYGRGLGRSFKEAIDHRCAARSPVLQLSYLRGLDGRLPSSGDAEEAGPAGTGKERGKTSDLGDVPREHAEGRNQYDYLRRIGQHISELDAKGGTQQRVRAVGIFGSDVYDKLLIMQALRPRLPGAVFFTTDLDARFLHRDQADWARNLVVASHFGLQLRPSLQGSAPPFRDGYQTAAYLATLIATSPDPEGPSRHIRKLTRRPRLFEIGRTRAVDLGAKVSHGECPSLEDCDQVHPDPILELPRWPPRLVLIILLLGAGLVLLTTRANRYVASLVHLPDRDPAERSRTIKTLVGWTIAAVAFVSILLLLTIAIRGEVETGEGEPFVWLEGVSTWPSHFIRFLALAIAVVLAAVAFRRLRGRATQISLDLHLPGPSGGASGNAAAPPQTRGASRRSSDAAPVANQGAWHRRIRWLRGPFVDFTRTERAGDCAPHLDEPDSGPGNRERISIARLWASYLGQTSGFNFWSWIVFATAVLGAFAYALYLLDPPFFPHRGQWVMRVNEVLWVLNVILLWATIFWTVYEARACAYFVDRLARSGSAWPEATLRQRSEAAGVPQPCLLDFLDFELILRASDRVYPILYIPFVQIFLLSVAFHPIFDKPNVPWPLIGIAAVSLAYALYATWVLRRSAERARSSAIANYQASQLWLEGGRGTPPPVGWAARDGPSDRPEYDPLSLNQIESAERPSAREQIRQLVDRIRQARDGPFQPVLQQPFVKALLIPFSGWSGMSLLEPILNYLGL